MEIPLEQFLQKRNGFYTISTDSTHTIFIFNHMVYLVQFTDSSLKLIPYMKELENASIRWCMNTQTIRNGYRDDCTEIEYLKFWKRFKIRVEHDYQSFRMNPLLNEVKCKYVKASTILNGKSVDFDQLK